MGGFSANTNRTDGSSTATLHSQPWVQQQPFLADIYGQGRDLYNQGGTPYYPGSTTAGFNPLQEQAFGQTQQNAGGTSLEHGLGSVIPNLFNQIQDPNTLSGRGRNELKRTASGQGHVNPYLDQTYDKAAAGISRQYANVTQPNSNLAFSRAGRSGSGQQALQNKQDFGNYIREQSGLATDIYGGAYQQERQNQLGAAQYGAQQGIDLSKWAASQVPIHSALLDNRTDRLAAAGQQVQDQSQRVLDDDVNRFNHYQGQPWENLQKYAQLILGQSPTQTESSSSSKNKGRSYGASVTGL